VDHLPVPENLGKSFNIKDLGDLVAIPPQATSEILKCDKHLAKDGGSQRVAVFRFLTFFLSLGETVDCARLRLNAQIDA
jgi:hypothetical protein